MGTPPNVIVLTSGLTGSSVLTGLVSRAGYWTGEQTHKKEYDTYENKELIKLDLDLFKQAGFSGSYTTEFSADAIVRIASLRGAVDDRPFREFVQKCEDHQPWIWKDPRLWLTIGFWRDLLPLERCRFILLTRDFFHAWVSSTLRRHIRSYGSLKRYEQSIKDSIVSFLDGHQLPYLHLTYENLIVHPEETIAALNQFLETDLSVKDLASIYHNPLYKTPRSSAVDYVKAALIYAKNFSERLDVAERRKPQPL